MMWWSRFPLCDGLEWIRLIRGSAGESKSPWIRWHWWDNGFAMGVRELRCLYTKSYRFKVELIRPPVSERRKGHYVLKSTWKYKYTEDLDIFPCYLYTNLISILKPVTVHISRQKISTLQSYKFQVSNEVVSFQRCLLQIVVASCNQTYILALSCMQN
jgi:hypothetical protein